MVNLTQSLCELVIDLLDPDPPLHTPDTLTRTLKKLNRFGCFQQKLKHCKEMGI